jgi:hypothetical protein
MKKKMILAGTLVLMMVGFLSAQYCPSPTSTRSGVYYGGLSSSSAYFTLNNYAFDVRRTLERGFNSGELTQHEVNVLEFDLERLERRIRRAYYDRRMTWSEWSMIEFDMRNIERNLRREWNDDERRLS